MAGAQVRRLVSVLRAPSGGRLSQEAAAPASRDDVILGSCVQLTLLLHKAPERKGLFLASEGPIALLELLGSTSAKVRGGGCLLSGSSTRPLSGLADGHGGGQ